jgi:hypothetical protein
VVVQGIMLAMRLQERYPEISITKSHPKALLLALRLDPWSDIADRGICSISSARAFLKNSRTNFSQP